MSGRSSNERRGATRTETQALIRAALGPESAAVFADATRQAAGRRRRPRRKSKLTVNPGELLALLKSARKNKSEAMHDASPDVEVRQEGT